MKISIITTVYKAEKDLPRLLDSMKAQKSKDLEFFLIDNGSPDCCGQICREYAMTDSRFTVYILKENIGYIRARNLGIQECHGDYIGFCDSDDYLEPGGYDKAIRKIQETNCDLYITTYKKISGSKTRVCNPPYPCGFYQNSEIMENLFIQVCGRLQNKEALQGFAWKQIFRRDIFTKFQLDFMPELQPYEDQILNLDFMKHSNKVLVDDTVIYNYIVNEESITAKLVSNFQVEEEWDRIERFRAEKLKRCLVAEHREACNNQMMDFVYALFINIAKQKDKSVFFVSKEIQKKVDRNILTDIVSDSTKEQNKVLSFVRWNILHEQYVLLFACIRLWLKVRG